MAAKILVVDDSAIVRQQVTWALMEAGFEVVEAIDGQDAADKIAAADQDSTGTSSIAMMVCDVNMPRMNGIELLIQLAGANHRPPFPVLMLTTDGHPELIAQAKGLGAKGWMVKPVQPAILVSSVRKLTGT